MNIEQQVVSLELAKKMKELGFDDYSFFTYAVFDHATFIWTKKDFSLDKSTEPLLATYPAYTVAELGNMLPWDIVIHRDIDKGWHITFQANGMTEKDMQFSEGPIETDARAKMLIYLAENNLINPKDITL